MNGKRANAVTGCCRKMAICSGNLPKSPITPTPSFILLNLHILYLFVCRRLSSLVIRWQDRQIAHKSHNSHNSHNSHRPHLLKTSTFSIKIASQVFYSSYYKSSNEQEQQQDHQTFNDKIYSAKIWKLCVVDSRTTPSTL